MQILVKEHWKVKLVTKSQLREVQMKPPKVKICPKIVFGWKFLKAAIVRCLRGSGLFLSWSRAPRCLSAAREPPTVVALSTTHSVKEGNLTLKYWCLCPVLHYGCFWKFSAKKYLRQILILVILRSEKSKTIKALWLCPCYKCTSNFSVFLLVGT